MLLRLENIVGSQSWVGCIEEEKRFLYLFFYGWVYAEIINEW